MEYAAVQRGIQLEKERLEPPAKRWYYSDQLLAYLMQICEQEGKSEFVMRARQEMKKEVRAAYAK
jgi:hypothetical protein